MARLISIATGNSVDASSWAVVDTTSLLDSEAANSALTTSYVTSSTFTPGAITIDGIAVKLASVAASPSGTISVALDQGGVTVVGTEVTLNVSDLPSVTSSTTNEGGWILFKFAAPVLLLAATAYGVKAKTSSSSQVNLFSSATTNWSRLLRTTTTAAPGAGDVMHVIGEHTGAGTGNSFVITWTNTATTDFGPGDNLPGLTIGKRGSVISGVTAATNYYLKMSGDIIGYNGGLMYLGEGASPIPSNSTFVLEFDPTADGANGLIRRNGFTFKSKGTPRTAGKEVVKCRLNTDEAAAQTVLGVDTDTGWLNGDQIVIAKTNRINAGQSELRTLSGGAGSSSLTISSGLTNSHSGTAPTQAHVILLTRNVIIRSATSTLMFYVNDKSSAVIDMQWTEMYYFGEEATGKRGIEVETTVAGSWNMEFCSIHDTEDRALTIVGSATNNINFENNVLYLVNTARGGSAYPISVAATTGNNIHITDNVIIRAATDSSARAAVNLGDVGLDFSRNAIADTNFGAGVHINESNGTIGTFDDNEVYGCDTDAGFRLQSTGIGGVINGLISWNNISDGLNINSSPVDLTINDAETYGNQTRNLFVGSLGNVIFNRFKTGGLTGFSTTSAIAFAGGTANFGLVFNDSEFSQASGQITAHSQDILMSTGVVTDMLFNNCLFSAATLVSSPSGMSATSEIRFHKFNQTENNHLWYTKYGIARSTGAGLTDTNIRTSGSLALRIAPSNASPGFSWEFQILAKANSAVSITGFIQKNAAFGTDDAIVELFLPGSTVADATQTMPDNTSWNVFNLAANYTGSVDLYATVRITAKTVAALAYIYIDDLYNGTNKITALDVWDKGQPSEIVFEQLGDAASVWAVALSTLTTPGTTGKKLKDALTRSDFIGLS